MIVITYICDTCPNRSRQEYPFNDTLVTRPDDWTTYQPEPHDPPQLLCQFCSKQLQERKEVSE